MSTLYQGEPSGNFQSQLKPMHNDRWRLACSTLRHAQERQAQTLFFA